MRYNLTRLMTVLAMVCILLSGCSRIKRAAQAADAQPRIFPDYIGVTIPVNIAPLNFMIEGAEHIQAVLSVGGKEQTTVCGSEGVVDIPADEWHKITALAAGKQIDVEVSVWNDDNPDGIKYKPFAINVSKDEIDPWIAYRLI